MSNDLFDSTNPYSNLEILIDRTPQGLLKQIKAIKTPIKIINIVAFGNRIYAYIMGDVRVRRPGRPKKLGD